MQNVCACGNQTRKQSKTRDSEGFRGIALCEFAAVGIRLENQDSKFVETFSSESDLYLRRLTTTGLCSLESSLKSWWAFRVLGEYDVSPYLLFIPLNISQQ